MPTSAELNVLCSGTYKAADAEGNPYSVAGLLYQNEYGEIFLPAAGCLMYKSEFVYADDCYYWSSTPYYGGIYNMDFLACGTQIKNVVSGISRYYGFSVRAVRCMNSFDGESYDNAMFESEKENKI